MVGVPRSARGTSDNAATLAAKTSGDGILRKIWNGYLSTYSFPNIVLGYGWLSLCYVVYKIFTAGTVVELWDPHSVLGIAASATRSEIKKAYRKLSLALHPDKVVESMRKEAEKKFVEVSKAYKVLTDAKAAANFEKYGNPDGPQATTFGIALPPWMTNTTFVIVAYLSVLALLGFVAYRYFTYGNVFGGSSDKALDNGLLKEPIEKLAQSFKQAKETSPPLSIDQVLTMVTGTARAHHPHFALTPDQLKSIPKSARDVSSNPAMQALQAHMHRSTGDLPADLLTTLDLASDAVLGLAVQRGRLVDLPACFAAQRAIITATKPGDSPLLALPHATPQVVQKLGGSNLSAMGLYKQGRAYFDAKVGNLLSEEQREEMWQAAGDAPYVAVSSATFGDLTYDATPGNETPVHVDAEKIAVTVKLVITTVRDQVENGEAAGVNASPNASPNKKAGKAGKKASSASESATAAPPKVLARELPPAFAHAPYFPDTKRGGLWLFLSETTRPKMAPILNGAFLALDDTSILRARDDTTGEVTVRVAIAGPKVQGTFSIGVHVFAVPHWFVDESRSFKMKLDKWSKKQRAVSGSEKDAAAAKDLEAKYPVIEVPIPKPGTARGNGQQDGEGELKFEENE
ncbi:hypothetical protein BCR44DRAFT_239247 [Catenaria anguillulae PL171]|uniref:J domain-containing protein n=1 Tax=Catenaria anguillulae PL171 TaxID=765915 RepID=A0A1Y2HD33_9FUNG|nr:hypothetical protein BCR44DRAFT_239247 [Catenaria anguillulae PL171]